MATKANRRGSVEQQQLTMWKHQQNLEEIKMLKANNSIPAPQSPKANQAPVNPAFQEKLGKLSARKYKLTGDHLRTSGASETLPRQAHKPDTELVSHFVPAVPAIQHIPLHSHANTGEHASRQNTPRSGAANHSGEVDSLLKEKQHWLRAIHEDNAKMAQMLKDLREAKQQLAQKMDELEVERRTLEQERAQVQQQQRANGQHAEIEDYLREDSELADEKRNLSLPAAHAEEGAQLLRELLIAAGKFRVNQGEAKEFFYKTVRQTVQSFVAGAIAAEEDAAERERALSDDGSDGRRYRGTGGVDPLDEYRGQVEVLRALAATGPGNLRAAENVAASVASSLIRAAGERTVDLLQLHQSAVEKREQLLLRDEITSLKQENNALRGSLAQMRKSNVQLRMKTAASILIQAKGRDRNGSDVGGGEGRASEAGDNSSYYREASESASVLPVDESSAEDMVSQAQQREEESQLLSTTGTAGLLQSNERLPRAVERFLLSELAQHAHEIIEGHPLAGSLSAAMVASLGKELSKEVGGIAAAAFFAFMHHRQGILELPECLINGTLTHFSSTPPADGDEPPVKLSAADRRVRDQVREAVEHVLQISSVHTELSALATLYLTYLHCRPRGDQEQELSLPGSAELDALSEDLGLERASHYSGGGGRGDKEVHEEFKGPRQGPYGSGGGPGYGAGEDEDDEESLRGIEALERFAAQPQYQSQYQQQPLPPQQVQGHHLFGASGAQQRLSLQEYSGTGGVGPGSPAFVRGGRPHPSSSPLPRYMQQTKGKR